MTALTRLTLGFQPLSSMTSLLFLCFISLALHALAFAVLIKHRRAVAHHRATTPTIGRNPQTMRTKVNAWLRRNA